MSSNVQGRVFLFFFLFWNIYCHVALGLKKFEMELENFLFIIRFVLFEIVEIRNK